MSILAQSRLHPARALSTVTDRRSAFLRSSHSTSGRNAAQVVPSKSFQATIWLVVVPIFMPATMAFFIGGAKITPGRIPLIILFFPALFSLGLQISTGFRRAVASDFLMACALFWMIGAPLWTGGFDTLASSGAEALELVGAYLVARAYFFDRAALKTFVQTLKFAAWVLIALSVLDAISGHDIVYETTARIFDAPYHPPRDMDREGFFRAKSTFDHAILFGAFSSIAAALFIYSESSPYRRLLYCSLCLLGVALSISSGPLAGYVIIIVSYTYDRILQNYAWRWKLAWVMMGAFISLLCVVSNAPIGWLITHLTFDPVNGYFRLAQWYAAFDQIALHPLAGSFRQLTGNVFLDSTTDSVWLVCALQYGLPFAAFLLLTNLSTLGVFGGHTAGRKCDPYLSRMRAGLSLMLVMFMFIGLTVHFWGTVWMFWGLCMGIRACLVENNISYRNDG